MKTLVLVVALVAGCAARHVAVVEPAPPPTPEAVVAQVTGLIEQWRQGNELRTIDALAPLYEQKGDLEVAYQGHRLRGWDAVRGAIALFHDSHPQIHILVADLRIISLGADGALAAASVTRRFGNGAVTIEEIGVIHWVLRRDTNGWKIVGEHWSYAGQ